MTPRDQLAAIFRDTQSQWEEDLYLKEMIESSKRGTKLFEEDDYPSLPEPEGDKQAAIAVSQSRTFERAAQYREWFPRQKVAVLNFASATRPGGGVTGGSSAQEESLCRCSTLYATLDQPWLFRSFYKKNREAANPLHTDACIYSPNVVICKSDERFPKRLPPSEYQVVDVISCAAPNLRRKPGNAFNPEQGNAVNISREELYQLHLQRAKHILHIAAFQKVDVLILGAFGCGAFENDPETVAAAHREALKSYRQYFDMIDYAIFTSPDETQNFLAFQRALSEEIAH